MIDGAAGVKIRATHSQRGDVHTSIRSKISDGLNPPGWLRKPSQKPDSNIIDLGECSGQIRIAVSRCQGRDGTEVHVGASKHFSAGGGNTDQTYLGFFVNGKEGATQKEIAADHRKVKRRSIQTHLPSGIGTTRSGQV